MVNFICCDLTAFAYTSLSNPDTSQTSVNLMCACLFLIFMDHLNCIFPSLKKGKLYIVKTKIFMMKNIGIELPKGKTT